MLLPWTRISSTPTVSLPAGLTARRATWWKTATAAWCTCQVRPRGSKRGPGLPQATLTLTWALSVLAVLVLVPEHSIPYLSDSCRSAPPCGGGWRVFNKGRLREQVTSRVLGMATPSVTPSSLPLTQHVSSSPLSSPCPAAFSPLQGMPRTALRSSIRNVQTLPWVSTCLLGQLGGGKKMRHPPPPHARGLRSRLNFCTRPFLQQHLPLKAER